MPNSLDPADRPRRHRATVRVLLVDEHDRILLFHDSDAPVGRTWWLTPGGGIDPGEDELTAVLREVQEETGRVLDPADVRGPIARRHVLHGYSDVVVDQDDTFYLVHVPAFTISTAGHTEDERRTMLGHRWWTRAELEAATDEIWPVLLPELWQLAGSPELWPVRLEDVEESSVAV